MEGKTYTLQRLNNIAFGFKMKEKNTKWLINTGLLRQQNAGEKVSFVEQLKDIISVDGSLEALGLKLYEITK